MLPSAAPRTSPCRDFYHLSSRTSRWALHERVRNGRVANEEHFPTTVLVLIRDGMDAPARLYPAHQLHALGEAAVQVLPRYVELAQLFLGQGRQFVLLNLNVAVCRAYRYAAHRNDPSMGDGGPRLPRPAIC